MEQLIIAVMAERIKALRAANTVEAAPQRMAKRQVSATEAVTMMISRREGEWARRLSEEGEREAGRGEDAWRVVCRSKGVASEESCMATWEGVLLDVDGTLVDSNDAHATAWIKALAEFGIQVDFAKVRRLIGKGGDKLLPEITGIEANSSQGKAISKRRGEIFQREFLPSLRPFPNARELLVRMKKEGLRLVVASSAKEDELKNLLCICGADGLVEASASSDDAGSSKPDSGIVHVALGKIDLAADKAILLGDTPYDVEAGIRAGVAVVALRCGGWGDSDLARAIALYDSPADLLARFDESPFMVAR